MPYKGTRTIPRPAIRVIGPSIAYIQLTQGYYALIDSCNAPTLEKFNWQVLRHKKKNGFCIYAIRTERKEESKRTLQMHRSIVKTPIGMDTDHKNGNGLDNRDANLRAATRSQNCHNKSVMPITKSGLKGVYPYVRGGWAASISVNGKRIYLGVFDTPELAHKEYAKGIQEHYGTFANTGER